MRVELEDGQWAELRERLDYGPAREIRRTLIEEPAYAFDIVVVAAYVSSWHVLSVAGEAVPLDKPELAPDDVIQPLAKAALEVWNRKHDPKHSGSSGASSKNGSSVTTPPELVPS